ncbi:Aldose 1-epimerase [Shewanella denitrificans OS217]|jgi:aldose 1-epimerase|uniref:Aldose 1-epimerase n=1 Tax=Shewanella denitrificans (strain OS217 / ATCC BAA-1090 / DSM 15013) TaxID=318161 RepID=Q12S70_SHEDO|nr:aldose epimerase family protein [Shewanella denitrificans]ABE53706.1 Aldose 1-epimerase [Shewanella denitrificans OS217]
MVRFSVLAPWQDPRGGEIERIRLDNGIIAIEVLSLGGIIRSLWAPDSQGERANLVLGCDSAADYLEQDAHLGAIAGRYANRIAKAKLKYQDEQYQLDANHGEHCLHGGSEGFNRKLWQLGTLPDGVRLILKSPDGEMGFPGNCTVQLDYRLVGNNLYVEMFASVDKACPVSLTQHSYFNLDASQSSLNHQLQSAATHYLTMDDSGIPIAKRAVKDSAFDLSQGVELSLQTHAPELKATQGFDHCYLMDNPAGELKCFGTLSSPVSGRRLTLYTNQASVQVYGANFLAHTLGRNQQPLAQYQGVCLEPQHLPDAPNQRELGQDPWLQPNKVYHHISRYQFDTI